MENKTKTKKVLKHSAITLIRKEVKEKKNGIELWTLKLGEFTPWFCSALNPATVPPATTSPDSANEASRRLARRLARRGGCWGRSSPACKTSASCDVGPFPPLTLCRI